MEGGGEVGVDEGKVAKNEIICLVMLFTCNISSAVVMYLLLSYYASQTMPPLWNTILSPSSQLVLLALLM